MTLRFLFACLEFPDIEMAKISLHKCHKIGSNLTDLGKSPLDLSGNHAFLWIIYFLMPPRLLVSPCPPVLLPVGFSPLECVPDGRRPELCWNILVALG